LTTTKTRRRLPHQVSEHGDGDDEEHVASQQRGIAVAVAAGPHKVTRALSSSGGSPLAGDDDIDQLAEQFIANFYRINALPLV
jgi:DNA-binding IclR family transcriptional regulator